jgi:hypothetical protein
MVTTPPSIFTPSSESGIPATPLVVFTPPSAGSPPAAPGSVFVPAAALFGDGTMTVSGILSPDASGKLVLISGALASALTSWAGKPAWSSNGDGTIPASGTWVVLRTVYLETPEPANIEQIFPVANYLGGTSRSDASYFFVNVYPPGMPDIYFLLANGGAPKWVKENDGAQSDRAGTLISQGKFLTVVTRMTDGAMIGGLGETWETAEDAVFLHELLHYTDGGSQKRWHAVGPVPQGATFTAVSGATGVPVLTYSTPQTTPPSIFTPA